MTYSGRKPIPMLFLLKPGSAPLPVLFPPPPDELDPLLCEDDPVLVGVGVGVSVDTFVDTLPSEAVTVTVSTEGSALPPLSSLLESSPQYFTIANPPSKTRQRATETPRKRTRQFRVCFC